MLYFCLPLLILSHQFLQADAIFYKDKADTLLKIAKNEVGINIKDNPNRVLDYLASVNLDRLTNFCAAFVRWCMDKAKIKFPVRSGLARAYKTKYKIKADHVELGLIKIDKGTLAIWERPNDWRGHIGIVDWWKKKFGQLVEGNTSSNSLRTGGYVQIKKRTLTKTPFRIRWFVPLYDTQQHTNIIW